MADLLKTGAAWLASQRATHAARSMSYARDAVELASSLAVSVGRTMDIEARQEGEGYTQYTTRELVFSRTELGYDPQIGDTLTEIDEDGQTRVYEVIPDGSQQVFRFLNGVHTDVVVLGLLKAVTDTPETI